MREGTDYTTIATLPLAVAGRGYTFYGLTEDGLAYGSEFDDSESGAEELSPMSAVLTDPASGRVTKLSDGAARREPTQFTAMTYSKGFVVWVETTSTILGAGDWALYVHDRAASTTRLAAKSSDTGADRVSTTPPGGVEPSIADGYVYLNAAGKVAGRTSLNVYRTRLDRPSGLRLVVKDAEGAFASAGRLVYRSTGGAMMQLSTTGDDVKPLGEAADVENACGGVFAAGTLVLCEGSDAPDKVLHVYRDGEEPIALKLRGGAVHYINATSRWVRYELDGTTYVYDLQRRRLMKVTDLYDAAVGEGPGDVLDVATIDEAAGETRAREVKFLRLLP